jgi:hypothetical protein
MVFWCHRGWYGTLMLYGSLLIWYSGAVEGWYGIMTPYGSLLIWYSGAIEGGMVL